MAWVGEGVRYEEDKEDENDKKDTLFLKATEKRAVGLGNGCRILFGCVFACMEYQIRLNSFYNGLFVIFRFAANHPSTGNFIFIFR